MTNRDTLPHTPPCAERIPSEHVLHGDRREDPYAWLRDPKWQEVLADPSVLDPKIRSYLTEENTYADLMMRDTGDLREKIKQEMYGRIEQEVRTPPTPDGDWEYYTRQTTGKDYPLFCRRSKTLPDAPEDVLLDGNTEAEGGSHFALGLFAHSPDHRLVMYSVDRSGSELYELFIKDLATGAVLPERLSPVSDAVFSNDSTQIYYTKIDDQHRPQDVYRHTIGTAPETDELIYHPDRPDYFVSLRKTEGREFIVITAEDHDSSESYLIRADGADRSLSLVRKRKEGVRYTVHQCAPGHVLVLSNDDDAEDFAVSAADLPLSENTGWTSVVPYRPGVLIKEILVFQDHLVRLEEEHALPRIVIRNREGEEHAITFAEEAYSLDLVPGFTFDTPMLRFVYSSPSTPPETYEYDMSTRSRVLLRRVQVPSGHDPKRYTIKRIFAESHDGVMVPVTLISRADLTFASPAPCHLYGYGAYGISMDASWSGRRLSLVDRGIVCAIAHIRGGMEGGYRWYLDGKLMQKRNTFLDLIAVADMLIENGYTAPKRIVIEGRSAGGLLVGAVLNMHPELFGAAVAGVPFVDALTTISDPTLPLTPMEWKEWGNPIESPDAYAYMRSYSPYDNVIPQEYPHLFVTAGLTDPRVTYWEPAKWVAKLRAAQQGNGVIMLRTEMEHGHAGATGRFSSLDEDAEIFAFIVTALSGGFDQTTHHHDAVG